jgi:hypothetical protein
MQSGVHGHEFAQNALIVMASDVGGAIQTATVAIQAVTDTAEKSFIAHGDGWLGEPAISRFPDLGSAL